MAPNETDKMLLVEMAEDEHGHAEEFKSIYHIMTGKCPNVKVLPPKMTLGYRETLRDRVLDESGDFRKYALDYLKYGNNIRLKQAFYKAHIDEGVHAMRLLYMLSK
jgi:hypothetical protein